MSALCIDWKLQKLKQYLIWCTTAIAAAKSFSDTFSSKRKSCEFIFLVNESRFNFKFSNKIVVTRNVKWDKNFALKKFISFHHSMITWSKWSRSFILFHFFLLAGWYSKCKYVMRWAFSIWHRSLYFCSIFTNKFIFCGRILLLLLLLLEFAIVLLVFCSLRWEFSVSQEKECWTNKSFVIKSLDEENNTDESMILLTVQNWMLNGNWEHWRTSNWNCIHMSYSEQGAHVDISFNLICVAMIELNFNTAYGPLHSI